MMMIAYMLTVVLNTVEDFYGMLLDYFMYIAAAGLLFCYVKKDLMKAALRFKIFRTLIGEGK